MSNPFGNLSDIFKLKNQLEDIQKDMGRLQATGYAGGDMASVTLDGNNNCIEVRLSDESMTLGRQAVETLVAAAINDANSAMNEKRTEYQQEKGRKLMPNLYGSN